MPARVAALIDERRRLERELADARRNLAMGGSARGDDDGVRRVGDIRLLARADSGIEIEDLRRPGRWPARSRSAAGVVAIVGVTQEGKAGLVVGVTADLVTRFSAVDLVRRRRRGSWRQGRRRPPRHGAGGRAGRRQGGSRARRHCDGNRRPDQPPRPDVVETEGV